MALDKTWFRLGTLACAAALPLVAAPASAQDRDRDQADVEVCPLCEAGAELVARFGLREAPTPVRERPGWTPPVRIVTTYPNAVAFLLRMVAPDAEVIAVSDLGAVPGVIAGEPTSLWDPAGPPSSRPPTT